MLQERRAALTVFLHTVVKDTEFPETVRVMGAVSDYKIHVHTLYNYNPSRVFCNNAKTASTELTLKPTCSLTTRCECEYIDMCLTY